MTADPATNLQVGPGALARWFAHALLGCVAVSMGAQETNTPAPPSQPVPVAATSASNAAPHLDYAAFALINERNIFNPNRSSRRTRSGQTARKAKIDTLSLVGTMSYEKGDFAFFDGSSAEFKRALKVEDAIAGYKIASITGEGVTLEAAGKLLQLIVGNHLRREEDGPWELSTSTPATTSTPDTAAAESAEPNSSDAKSDVLERLLKKRQQELKDEKP